MTDMTPEQALARRFVSDSQMVYLRPNNNNYTNMSFTADEYRKIRAALSANGGEAAIYNGWYCAHCECGVDSSEVTFNEAHTVCGRIITHDEPPPVAVPEEKGFADAPPELDNNEAVAWVNGYHQCRDDMLSAAPPPVAQNVEWFFYDAENGNIEICETKEEAISKAQKAVDFCLDEFWSDDVEYICVGTITHRAKQTDLRFKPQKLDEDMFSEDGEHWPEDCESKCDYSIEPIDPQPQGGGK